MTHPQPSRERRWLWVRLDGLNGGGDAPVVLTTSDRREPCLEEFPYGEEEHEHA